VARTYAWLTQQWWFRHDTFEPLLSTASFAVWVHIFSLIDRCWKGSRQFLVDDRQRDLSGHSQGSALLSGIAYLLPLLLHDYLNPRRAHILLTHAEAPTTVTLLGTVLLTIVLYDLAFYPIHWYLHNGPQVIRDLHNRHHDTNRTLISTDVLRHGLIDGTAQVVVNVIVLNITRAHPLARALHDIVLTFLLTEAHSGFDFPWSLHRIVPKNLYGGSAKHFKHHCGANNKNYQQLFSYLDVWFSTNSK
jgi:cholesterol 25-hydroxylase